MGLGRLTSATDALLHTIATGYSVVCGAAGTGDTACYEQKLTTDPAGHRGGTLLGAMGAVFGLGYGTPGVTATTTNYTCLIHC
jgi:hypothetical protein